MKKTVNIFSLITLIFIFSCADPYEKDLTLAYEELPVSKVLESETERFSLWVELLKETGLYTTLNLQSNYTVFAPENSGVERYLVNNNYSSIKDIPSDVAKHLVKYHVISGNKFSQSLFSNGVIPDTTATGDFLSIEMRAGGLNAIYVNGESRITQLDISATNGVIHALENVLNPISETIWDVINRAKYTIFKELVEKTGYNDELKIVNYQVENQNNNISQQKRKFFTCFIIPDEIYKKLNINSADDLIKLLNEDDKNYKDKSNLLNQYVAYHLLDQQLDFNTLSTFSGDDKSKNIQTLAKNQLINFSQISEALFVNSNSEEGALSIIETNINAKNGVAHEVNGLMLVSVPPITTVLWELTEYSDISALFPSEYRQAGLTYTFQETIKVGDVNCYNWEAIPTDRNNSAVYYYVANKNSAVQWGMKNHDCLVFRGGLSGWIDLETPTIVKGKYTMKIRYYSANAATKYGKFLTILNGEYIGGEIATHGSSTTTAKLETATIGVVEFNETTSHKVRLLASDDGMLYLDYIEFVPVK